MPIAWKNSSTSTGVGAAPTLTATIWSKPRCGAQAREQLRVGLGDRGGQLGGDLLARLLEADLLAGGGERRLAPRRAAPRGSPASIASRPALSFSQMRGTAKNQLGRTSAM